jgi:hypothetical protein
VNRGELGISWRSGWEEESSIQAEKAYRTMIEGVSKELETLVMLSRVSTTYLNRVQ